MLAVLTQIHLTSRLEVSVSHARRRSTPRLNGLASEPNRFILLPRRKDQPETLGRDGTTHVIFEPQELMEKLAGLVPAPRLNLTRFHAVLELAAQWRAAIVPRS